MDYPTDRFLETIESHPFDRYFSDLLRRIDPEVRPVVLFASVAARKAVSDGHACIDLGQFCSQQEINSPWFGRFTLPAGVDEWQKILATACFVGDGRSFTPLVLDGTRLYLRRYWQYEKEVAEMLLNKAQRIKADFPHAQMQHHVQQVFSVTGEVPTPEHILAVETALSGGLTVISGGPGTGKTSVVAKILVLLQTFSMAQGNKQRILLLAPTGKAAAKLGQTLREKLAYIPADSAIKEAVPSAASTIHRILGRTKIPPSGYKGTVTEYVPADLVIIDEASMVDLSLLHKLLHALPEKCSLILLGDRDQLASVEAGSIFSDICDAGVDLDEEGELSGNCFRGSVVRLQKSFRFSKEHGIGQLAEFVKNGNSDKVLQLLDSSEFNDLNFIERLTPSCRERFESLVRAGYSPVLQAPDALTALRFFDRFRILCALRHGPDGSGKMNELAEYLLKKVNFQARGEKDLFYKGRPIIITRNCYPLGLFNGDTGILWPDQERGGELRAFFYGAEEQELRSISPARLPSHETAYAMTIHKSQGSEFEEAAVVLPSEMSPVLSRELFYTALTRSRSKVTLYGHKDIIAQAVNRKVERASGLQDLLRGGQHD